MRNSDSQRKLVGDKGISSSEYVEERPIGRNPMHDSILNRVPKPSLILDKSHSHQQDSQN